MKLFRKLKTALCGEKTLSDYLAETGLEETDLQKVTATLEVETDKLSDEQKSQLANEESFKAEGETYNFTGMELISCVASAMTIISTLISLEKWVGSNFFVTITLNGIKHRVTVNQGMALLFETVKNKINAAQ